MSTEVGANPARALVQTGGRARYRLRLPLGLAGVGLLAVLVLAACIGPVATSPGEVAGTLGAHIFGMRTGVSPVDQAIIWDIRLPRIVLAALAGALLAGSGAAYQGVLRNSLADPYLLGVAAGAGLGATAAIITGRDGSFVLPLVAFAGGLLAVVLTYVISAADRGSSYGVILAGVAVAAMLTAVQTFLQQQHTDEIRQIYNWLLGSFSVATWSQVLLVLPYLALSAVVLLLHRRALDVLRVGAAEAGTLGLHPTRTRLVIIGAATLGTAAAVSVSGLIGFVGIIVPHAVRLTTSASYRMVMPLAMIGGAAFLVLADLVARVVEAPAELPIGVVTALVGGPFFLAVLRSRPTRGRLL